MLPSDLVLRPYLQKMTLLCVDDSEVMKLIYTDLFGTLFKEVCVVKSGEEGIAFCDTNEVDLIVCEYALPFMNGIEMIEHIRKTGSKIPIILVTQLDDPHILIEAIGHHVSNFVKKPFDTTDLLDAIERAIKLIIADKFIYESQQKQFHLLEKKVAYVDYQEELSFQKELMMIRNDFYYHMITPQCGDEVILADFLYMPKDILSGDSYSARKLDNERRLYFIVDAMGKGVSASVSAMMSISFINHTIDKILTKGIVFDFQKMIKKVIFYIQGILLEEEILSIIFFMADPKAKIFEYASFSMPPLLLMHKNNQVESLKSNNIAINKYVNTYKTTKISCESIAKVLIYSDGLPENSLKEEEGTYERYLKEDFKRSVTREDLRQKIVRRIATQEDDMTFILLNVIQCENEFDTLVLNSTLEEVEKASEWFSSILENISLDAGIRTKTSLAFNELVMNAYEHGNLNIDKKKKHELLENDEYFDFLKEHEKLSTKEIKITLHLFCNPFGERYLLTCIGDEGNGFDTAFLANVFGIKKSYNGRGIFISRRSTLGIYYNPKGNRVVFISKL